MSFSELKISEELLSPFKKIGKDWFLITSGNENDFNTMTAGWGGMGVMWAKDIFLAAVRTSRHTYNYIENNDYFSICFFDEKYKDVLSYCGKYSGKDVDKVKETNLTTTFIDGVPCFEEASLVLICKKVYRQSLDESCFIEKDFLKFYEKDAFHIMYAGEIIKTLKKD